MKGGRKESLFQSNEPYRGWESPLIQPRGL